MSRVRQFTRGVARERLKVIPPKAGRVTAAVARARGVPAELVWDERKVGVDVVERQIRETQWVRDHLKVECLMEEAPSPAAWDLLLEARRNPHWFLTVMWPKIIGAMERRDARRRRKREEAEARKAGVDGRRNPKYGSSEQRLREALG